MPVVNPTEVNWTIEEFFFRAKNINSEFIATTTHDTSLIIMGHSHTLMLINIYPSYSFHRI